MSRYIKRTLSACVTKKITHAAVVVVATAGLLFGTSTAASAGGGLKSIVCGGQKYGNWSTYPSGGYVGEGCGAGIDYTPTPTSAWSDYNLGFSDGTSTVVQAWIPTTLATAMMNFDLYVCGNYMGTAVVNEAIHNGWVTLYSVPGGHWGCLVKVQAWSGQVSTRYLGLDAIRTHT